MALVIPVKVFHVIQRAEPVAAKQKTGISPDSPSEAINKSPISLQAETVNISSMCPVSCRYYGYKFTVHNTLARIWRIFTKLKERQTKCRVSQGQRY